ncbi:MAG: hypothetical protein IPP23_10055 [Sphingomonadales bacterium]|nr:hypothetical protein [Sphingomonadales bacterium]
MSWRDVSAKWKVALIPGDPAHKRPWLFASLLFGLTYPLSWQLASPEFGNCMEDGGRRTADLYALAGKHHVAEFLPFASRHGILGAG